VAQSEFKAELLDCDNVLDISDHHKPNVLKIKCNKDTYALWKHRSKNFNQWYWSAQKCRLLSIDPPTLIHAFLGSSIENRYVIPHEDVASPMIETGFVRRSGNDYWHLSVEGQRRKLDQYSSMCEYL